MLDESIIGIESDMDFVILEISFLSCEVQKFKKQEIHISEQYTNCPVQKFRNCSFFHGPHTRTLQLRVKYLFQSYEG